MQALVISSRIVFRVDIFIGFRFRLYTFKIYFGPSVFDLIQIYIVSRSFCRRFSSAQKTLAKHKSNWICCIFWPKPHCSYTRPHYPHHPHMVKLVRSSKSWKTNIPPFLAGFFSHQHTHENTQLQTHIVIYGQKNVSMGNVRAKIEHTQIRRIHYKALYFCTEISTLCISAMINRNGNTTKKKQFQWKWCWREPRKKTEQNRVHGRWWIVEVARLLLIRLK